MLKLVLLLGIALAGVASLRFEPTRVSEADHFPLPSPPPRMYLSDSAFPYGPPLVTQFTVYAGIQGVPNLETFSFDVLFDDSVISFLQVAPGSIADQNGPPVCSQSSSTGEMSYSCVITGGGVNGNGFVAQIDFAYDQPFAGTLNFTMENCSAENADGDPVPLNGCDDDHAIVDPLPDAAQMTMSPALTKVQAVPGQTIAVDAIASTTTQLGGLEFNVAFDDTKLNLTSITEGPFLSSGGGDTVCFFTPPPSIFSAFGCAKLGKHGTAIGSGTIAHLEFTVKVPFTGTTAISLADCELADEQGFKLPVDECGGATIQSNPTPTPTATATATPFPVGGIAFDTQAPQRSGAQWPLVVGLGALGLAAVSGATWRLANGRRDA